MEGKGKGRSRNYTTEQVKSSGNVSDIYLRGEVSKLKRDNYC